MKQNIFPLVVLSIIAGIILQKYLSFPPESALPILLSLSITFSILLLLKTPNILKSLSAILSFVAVGISLYAFSGLGGVNYPFDKSKLTKVNAFGKIKQIGLHTDKKFTFILESDSIRKRKQTFRFPLSILVNVYPDTLSERNPYDILNIGNIVRIEGTLLKPRGRRNPFEFDYAEYLSGKGISAQLNVYKAKDIAVLSDQTDAVFSVIHSVRKKIDEIIHDLYDYKTASLLRGLLLADRSQIDYSLKTEFVNAGVIHVLAVSGLHVGYILLIFLFLFGRFNIYLRYVLTIFGLIAFVLITGMPTSVVRASLMAIAAVISLLSGRRYNLINALALAALIILIITPRQLFDPGFQLSFSAVLAIVILAPLFADYINKFNLNKTLRHFLLFISVSLAAQIGTLPFTLYYFHKLSLISFIANLFVIPMIGIILAVGILSLALYPVSVWAAEIYAYANIALTALLNYTVSLFGGSNYSYVEINSFSLYDSVLYFLSLAMLFYVLSLLRRIKSKVIAGAAVIISFFILESLDNIEYLEKGKLNVIAVDVGQGDSFLVTSPEGESALIDCGAATRYFDCGERIVAPLLKKLNVSRLKYIFISHLDNDHYGGFYSIVTRIKTDTVYFPRPIRKDRNEVMFENFLRANKIPYKFYQRSALNFGGSKIIIFNDTTNVRLKFNNRNDNSGLIKIVCRKNSILFTGDLGAAAERGYCSVYDGELKSDILKAGHHGSKTSSSNLLLDVVSPRFALISAGENNKFNHPSFEVVAEFKLRNISVFRTDKSGAVILNSDGDLWRQVNWRSDW